MGRLPVAGPVVIPQAAIVKLHWQNSGESFTNAFTFRIATAGAIDGTLAELLFAQYKTQFTSSGFAAQCADNTTFTGVSVKDVRQANMPEFMSSGAAAPGGDATGDLPEQVALVITERTARSGREFRGRVYFGGLGLVAQADARHFTGTATSTAKAFLDGIMSTSAGQGLQLGVGQRALQAGEDANHNPLPARAAQVVDVVATEARDNRIDTQRRRLGR